MKLSARNQFAGTVTKVNEGAVNGIVSIDVNGSIVSSTMQEYHAILMCAYGLLPEHIGMVAVKCVPRKVRGLCPVIAARCCHRLAPRHKAALSFDGYGAFPCRCLRQPCQKRSHGQECERMPLRMSFHLHHPFDYEKVLVKPSLL